jgi:hypothetical protein
VENLESNFIHIISTIVVFAASSIPLHFALKIKTERQRILSSLLFASLMAYGIHSIFESSEIAGYQILTKICFIISAFGLMAAYFFYQVKTHRALVAGMFGIAMIMGFGTWMAGELIEVVFAISPTEEEEFSVTIIDNISAIMMGGFGIFLIARFFWLRSVMPIEPRSVRTQK